MSARQPEMPAATIGSLVEMRDKAVCHQHSNGREIPCACMMGPSDVVYVEKRSGPRTDPRGTPVTN